MSYSIPLLCIVCYCPITLCLKNSCQVPNYSWTADGHQKIFLTGQLCLTYMNAESQPYSSSPPDKKGSGNETRYLKQIKSFQREHKKALPALNPRDDFCASAKNRFLFLYFEHYVDQKNFKCVPFLFICFQVSFKGGKDQLIPLRIRGPTLGPIQNVMLILRP